MIKDFEQVSLNLSQGHPLYDKIVPKHHPLLLINECIDFSFVIPLLGIDYGRPAYSPGVMFKVLFLKILYNLSDESVIQEAREIASEILKNETYQAMLSVSDPEAKMAYKSQTEAFDRYKSHIAITEDLIITTIEVITGEVSDGKYLETLVEKLKKNAIQVKEVLADAAYSSKENLE